MLISVSKASKIIDVSPTTVYRFIEQGKLHQSPNVEGVRLDEEEVKRFAEKYHEAKKMIGGKNA